MFRRECKGDDRMEHVKIYTIVDRDIDELGHMNYLKYVKHFEIARFEWFNTIGVSLDEMIAKQLGLVLLKFDTEYVKEVRLGDTVEIHTKLLKVGTKSFTVEQIMYHEGAIASKSHVIKTVMDLQTRKAIPVPSEIVNAFIPH